MEELYLKHSSPNFQLSRATAGRLLIEPVLRSKNRYNIDCYGVEHVPEHFIMELYGALFDSFDPEDVVKYVSYDNMSKSVRKTFEKVIADVANKKGIIIPKKP
jgi:hypothetical protein